MSDRLVDAWQVAAASAGWVPPDEWWHPAVEAAATAVELGDDPEPAVRRLGRARADAGVSLGDALGDLATLFELAAGGLPPLEHALELASSHGAGQLERLSGLRHEDPVTHLVPLAYLHCRLAEEYRSVAVRGAAIADLKALVVVGLGRPAPPGLADLAGLARVGRVVRSVFGRGETCARAGNAHVLVLVDRSARLGPDVELVRQRLVEPEHGASSTRARVEPLAATYEASVGLLRELAERR